MSTRIHKSALVPYGADEMFALVADIESYSAFLPWCGGSRILAREAQGVVAAVDIAHSGIHKTFTTRNTLVPYERIEMRLLDGPFSHLEGLWQFQALGERESKTSLDLEFEFSNKLLGFAMRPAFTKIADSMVDSFLQRAIAVHGRR